MSIDLGVTTNSISKESRHDFHTGLFILLAVLFIPVLFLPMINAPDTQSYLSLSSQRPPLLPLLLNLDLSLLGKSFILTRCVQIGLMVAAVYHLDKWLRREMNVQKYAVLILVFLFLLPLIYHGNFGRLLLSEALSLPLYVFTLVAACKLFLQKTLKSAMVFSLLASLLILTRNQFYFLYAFFPLCLLWCGLHRVGINKFLKLSGIFTACVVGTSLLSMGYHQLVNHKFANTTANGPLLFVQPLFLSHRTDAQYFSNPEEKAAFLNVYDSANQKGFLKDGEHVGHQGFNLGWNNLPRYVHFVDVFDPTQFDSVNVINQMGYNNYSTDHLMKDMTKVLLLHNLKENLEFYFWKFSFSFGGPLLLVVFVMLTFIAAIAAFKNKHNPVAIITLVLLAIAFLNNLVIALAEMVLSRYLIYPSLALSVLALILFGNAFNAKASVR